MTMNEKWKHHVVYNLSLIVYMDLLDQGVEIFLS